MSAATFPHRSFKPRAVENHHKPRIIQGYPRNAILINWKPVESQGTLRQCPRTGIFKHLPCTCRITAVFITSGSQRLNYPACMFMRLGMGIDSTFILFSGPEETRKWSTGNEKLSPVIKTGPSRPVPVQVTAPLRLLRCFPRGIRPEIVFFSTLRKIVSPDCR